MNKLWVRLSISFVVVILAVSIVAALAVHLSLHSNLGFRSQPPPEVEAYLREARRDNLLAPLPMIFVVVTVATVAGIWMSRTLTKPMAELGQAAQAIGRQDLNQRVSIKGTDEVRTLAQRFNEMAEQLEDEELLRRNLLADVAHELRNPLHVLRGNLQAILDGVYPLSKEEIARLSDQTHHLTALVDDLHELAQAEAHQLPLYKQYTDLAELVKQTTVAFKAIAASKDIRVQEGLLGTMPNLNVDPERIRQALSNLLINALQHTPAGGRVNVIAEQREGSFCIVVQDTGSGISEDELPRVFDRFYRSNPARSRDSGGSGLGLAIVEAIVAEHGGRVEADSPGLQQGSTFTIYLPVNS